MAKKKFADGGFLKMSGLGDSVTRPGFPGGNTGDTGNFIGGGGGGGGGGARGGLDTINQGSSVVSNALDQIGGAIGGGGGGGGGPIRPELQSTTLKKGGAVKEKLKSKISTGESSGKKSNRW